jgi:FkbM family methyltransferase
MANTTSLKIIELNKAYKQGAIDKKQYNDAMAERHTVLFDYQALIKNSNIESLTITENDLIARFRSPAIRMVCPYGDTRTAALGALTAGDYEPTEIKIVTTILRMLGEDISFFDIGANVGFYSLVLSSYFPNLKGYAFEPIPSTFGYLKRNFELNNISNIKAVNIGLSDKSGEFVFYSYPSHLGASSLAITVEASDRVEISCAVSTLDEFIIKENKKIDFIKCDVEGAELKCFKGGLVAIKKNLPVIFVEMLRKWSAKFNYHPNEIIKLLTDIGYICFDFSTGKLVKFEKMEEETIATNFIFLHIQKHKAIIEALI